MHILLFGGTTEGRRLAEWLLGRGHTLTYCAATGYGAGLIPPAPGLAVHTGRLDQGGMEGLIASAPWVCAVDATHPYAARVTQTLKAACAARRLPCYRLVRPAGERPPGRLYASDAGAAARLLLDREGPVLLTTGSKELEAFALPGLRERCFPRVLPTLEALGKCLELGFSPARILCMQGPFSRELNAALLRQYGIKTLVTKASGSPGGFWEKVQAAEDTGAALLVIDRPSPETGYTYDEMTAILADLEAQT